MVLLDEGRVIEVDNAKDNKIRWQVGGLIFPLDVQLIGEDRLLVPHNGEGKVVEYDSKGKILWEVAIEEPVAATRLPNGNTLVTTMRQDRAVEFDRNGRQVWEYRTNTRVTRALRR